MYRKVKDFIVKNNMIEKGSVVLSGLSGGGDSMAMLFLLWEFRQEVPFELIAVHVHHGIRGAEADRDMQQAKMLCERLKIPFHVHYYDVPALAKQWKTGMEEAGRAVRREAFDKEVCEYKEKGRWVKVALAHNKNDLAETMLHHLSRGTGLRGLASMRPVSGRIIRPVLCLEKKEIENCLEQNKIPFETDSSNLCDDYTRNRIRHHVLPVMEQEINTGTVEHMAQTALMLAKAEDYLREQGRLLIKAGAQPTGGYLLKEAFFKAPEILQSYGIQEIVEKLSGCQRNFTSRHVEMVRERKGMQTGKEVCLPYGLIARKTYDGIIIGRKRPPEDSAAKNIFSAEIFSYSGQKIEEKKYTKWMDYDKITGEISIRTRQSGDFMIVDEKGSHKKLTRVMIDDRIPREQREQIPVIACGSEVLWIVGGRLNQRIKITEQTRRILEVKYEGGQINE